MIADRAEPVAHLHSIRVLFPDLSVPVVQRKEQGFPNPIGFPRVKETNSVQNARNRQLMPKLDNYLAISGDAVRK
jgi:hypothetical protein